MTDKLQDFAKKWIESRTDSARDIYREHGDVAVIPADEVRAFLAQYVLCEKKPTAWQAPNGYLFPTRSEAASYADDDEPETPLHAPAKEPGHQEKPTPI